MSVNRVMLARQQEAGRRALLDAALRVLERGTEGSIPTRAIAAEAGVSERTVFRYFPDRDALAAALVPVVHARLDGVAPPPSVAELPAYVEELYRVCEANAGLVRSLLHTDLGRGVLRGVRSERVAVLRQLLGADGPGRPAAQAAATTIRSIASGAGWDFYRHQAGLTPDEALAAARWAVRALLTAAAADADG